MSDGVRKAVGRNRVVLAWLLSLAVLVVLARKTGVRLDRIGEEFREANWAILIAAMVFSVLWHIFVGADKWWRILRAQGAPVKYWEVFRVRLGSDPVRFATPFKLGEIVNAAYFGKIQSFGFSRAAGSIAFDKALNFFGTVFWLYVGIAGMTIAAIARMPTTENKYLVNYLIMHTAVGGAVLVLICVRPVRQVATALAGKVHPKLGRFAAGVLSAFEEFSPARKIGFLVYGIVFQLRPLVVCYLLFAAFSSGRFVSVLEQLSVGEFLVYGSVVVLMSNVPLTVAGIGPRETTLYALFKNYAPALFSSGNPQATLYLIGLMMSVSIHVLPAILGIPLMFPLLRAVTRQSQELRLERTWK